MLRRPRTALWMATLVVTSLAVSLPSGAAQAADPAFLTLMLGRSQWVSTEGCSPMPNTITLQQIADELQGRGLTATGLVVTTPTQATTRYCQTNIGVHASWADLALLRDTYGWSFDSTGAQHRNMLTLTPEQQLQESCGSLTVLRNHGHDRSGSLFGYPNNNYDDTMQDDVVSTCFDFGRRYRLGGDPAFTTRDSALADGGLQWTLTINGNMPARYTPRQVLADTMDPAPGEWAVVQAYRFVTGAHTGPASGSSWNCTSPDPAQHWTSRAELYCWDDFRWALDQIGDDVVVTDARTVAEAWFGPGEPDPDTQAPVPTVTAPAIGATVPAPVQITGGVTDNVGVTQVEIAIRNNATMQWWTGSGWGTFRYLPATVGSPGATTSAWSTSFNPPAAGSFGYQVRASDTAGNISAPTQWRTFTAQLASDTQAPVVTVTAPAIGATVTTPVQITGSVTDNVGVTQVEIAIRNNSTMQWWTGSGWGAFRYVTAVVGSPGATSSGWSYTFGASAAGSYGYQVRARDAAGNSSAPTQWRTFRIV